MKFGEDVKVLLCSDDDQFFGVERQSERDGSLFVLVQVMNRASRIILASGENELRVLWTRREEYGRLPNDAWRWFPWEPGVYGILM